MNKYFVYLSGFIGGACILSFFSIFQKIALGADPFKIVGFVVPVLFGGSAGLFVSVSIYKIKKINRNLSETVETKTKNIRNLLTEKEMLLKEVHHRIKNNMTVIRSLLYMHADTDTLVNCNDVLHDAIAKIDSMGVLYNQLFTSENYQTSSVKEYIHNLLDKIYHIFPEKKHINIEEEIEDFELKPQIIFPLGLLLNELFTNSMKYAFKGRESGIITISLSVTDNHVTLIFRDNGVGIPESTLKNSSKGFGFKLIELLTKQIGGRYRVENNNGTKFIIDFEID